MGKLIAVLAFSGGLDTSFCVPWLQEQGYDVVTVTVDTGGFSAAERAAIEARAAALGVHDHTPSTGARPLWDLLVSYIIKGNILRGGVYPLCAGPERLIQAMQVVAVARQLRRDGHRPRLDRRGQRPGPLRPRDSRADAGSHRS